MASTRTASASSARRQSEKRLFSRVTGGSDGEPDDSTEEGTIAYHTRSRSRQAPAAPAISTTTAVVRAKGNARQRQHRQQRQQKSISTPLSSTTTTATTTAAVPGIGSAPAGNGWREVLAADSRPICFYHPKCYRKNADHLEQYAHPPIASYGANTSMSETDEELEKSAQDAFEKEWILDYRHIKFGEQIGTGSFGQVRKAVWKGKDVAVKLLHQQNPTPQQREEFFQEAKLLKRLRHPHIVTWFGICSSHMFCIVMEFVCSSLERMLKGGPVPEEICFPIARDIADGLHYLHSLTPPIIHRDIKPANILIDEHFNAKIADFGISKERTNATMTKIGTPSFMAPEICTEKHYGTEVDVYSFGMLLWAMVTGKTPFADLEVDGARLLLILWTQQLRPTLPVSITAELQHLMELCWHVVPQARPSAKTVLEALEFLINHHATPTLTSSSTTLLAGDEPANSSQSCGSASGASGADGGSGGAGANANNSLSEGELVQFLSLLSTGDSARSVADSDFIPNASARTVSRLLAHASARDRRTDGPPNPTQLLPQTEEI